MADEEMRESLRGRGLAVCGLAPWLNVEAESSIQCPLSSSETGMQGPVSSFSWVTLPDYESGEASVFTFSVVSIMPGFGGLGHATVPSFPLEQEACLLEDVPSMRVVG